MKAIRNWMGRHQNRTNFWLHMLGVPASFVAAPVLLALRQWQGAALLLVIGYLLQFLGHLVEGNRSGEEQLVRRVFHRR